MKALDWRLACQALLLGLALGGRGAWLWQANAYDKQLAIQTGNYVRQLSEKERAHGREREAAADAALEQLVAERDRRIDLEARLQQQTQTHWKELKDAQQNQARLRDRLATADLRLSVLVDAGAFAGKGCDGGVREAAGTGGMVYGAVRAQLDPAHAQRIVSLTEEGDRGLIALKACQGYIKTVTH